MTHRTIEPAVIVSEWDSGGIVEELTTDETIAAIAKRLKVDAASVRQALIDTGRIEV